TENVWTALGSGAAEPAGGGAADDPGAWEPPGADGDVDCPQAVTTMAPTVTMTSSLVVRRVRIDRSSSGAFVTLRADRLSRTQARHERRLIAARAVRAHHDALDVIAG